LKAGPPRGRNRTGCTTGRPTDSPQALPSQARCHPLSEFEIDFESPRRLRIQGVARVTVNAGPDRTPGALYQARITASQVFVNCGRYIYKLTQQKLSPHVLNESGHQPFPAWKRIDVIADALSDSDKRQVMASGGTTPAEAYPGEDLPAKDKT
jgi:uncharacterized protein